MHRRTHPFVWQWVLPCEHYLFYNVNSVLTSLMGVESLLFYSVQILYQMRPIISFERFKTTGYFNPHWKHIYDCLFNSCRLFVNSMRNRCICLKSKSAMLFVFNAVAISTKTDTRLLCIRMTGIAKCSFMVAKTRIFAKTICKSSLVGFGVGSQNSIEIRMAQ